MAMVRNCVVQGIEPVNVKRKSDGKEFNFYKLHLTHEFSRFAEGAAGTAVLNCTVYPEVMEQEDITLGSIVDVFRKGNSVEFVRVC